MTAENLADQYDVSRADCDAYAARSQETWAAAQAAGNMKRVSMELGGHAPFVVFPDVSAVLRSLGMDEHALADRIHKEARVALVPGSPRFFGPGAAGHLRLSLATSRGLLSEALDRLEQWFQREVVL